MHRVINIRKSFPAAEGKNIQEAVEFIGSSLREIGVNSRDALKAELLAEESAAAFLKHSEKADDLYVRIRRFFGNIQISLSMRGERFDPFSGAEDQDDDEDRDALENEDVIRSILFRSYGENFKYSHQDGRNKVRIEIGQSGQAALLKTLVALVLGLLTGLLLQSVLPGSVTDVICGNILNPLKKIFMNAIMIIIAPVVFFSIVTCVSQFKNITELGRMALKIVGTYMLTTILAVLVGIGISSILRAGEWGFALAAHPDTAGLAVNADVDTSLINTIVNIVPSNFLQPFVNSDTLQIIFLAFVCGIAVGAIGEYGQVLRSFFEACNSLFLTITSMIARFIPVAVFCSVTLLVVSLDAGSLLSVLGVAGVHILAITIMLCLYGLLILIVGRLNPITFFRKNREGMLTSFTLSSSSAAMPVNLRTCTEKLGISPKVANFSIPLGATINMDGSCIFLSVLGLFLARAYGVAVPPSALVSLGITIILLSLGAPGVPGSGLVCLGVILRQLHVPVEAIGLVIAINPFLDMFDTMSNTTGDVTAALLVARSEKMLDLDKFKAP